MLANGTNPPKIMPYLGDCYDSLANLRFEPLIRSISIIRERDHIEAIRWIELYESPFSSSGPVMPSPFVCSPAALSSLPPNV